MSIEGVASYADVYSENLTEEDIKDFDDLGVEWRGRNILDIRDDFCIKAIEVYARIYEQKALTDPAELPQLKAEIVQIFEDIFDTESEDEDETSSLLYRFDPISGTYRELIGAEGGFIKSAGKCFKKAGKGIEKGVKKGVRKAKKAVTKAVRETGRWVKEHPVETAVIVAAVVTLGVTAGAVAGAGSALTNSLSDDDRKKEPNKDDKSSSSPPPPTPPQNTSTSVNSGPVSEPSPFNPISPLTPGTSPQFFSTSNPLPHDPFPHTAPSNYSYRLSATGSGNSNSYPAPLVTPNSLIPEYKTYSAPASITDIPKSSSYATSYKGTPTLTNHLPKSPPPIENYKQEEFSPSLQSGIDSTGSLAFLSPTSHEFSKPQIYPISPMIPHAQEQNKADTSSKDVSSVNLTPSFLEGVKEGAIDSVTELPSTISTLVKAAGNYALDPFIHPLQNLLPGQKLVSHALAIQESISYLQTFDKAELAKALVPEVYELVTEWDNLSPQDRVNLSGYCVGKYGTDILLPAAAAKGAKIAVNLAKVEIAASTVLKEAVAAGKIDGVTGAAVKEGTSLVEQQALLKKNILPKEGLNNDVAEVIENTKKAVRSEVFVEGELLAEEINNSLNNPTNLKLGRNITDLEKELFSTVTNGKNIKEAGLNIEALARAGKEFDRAGLTRAGRALDKHGNRENSIFPKAIGIAEEKNLQGQLQLDEILNHPESRIFLDGERGIEIYSPDGKGAYFTKDGKFRGFVNEQLRK